MDVTDCLTIAFSGIAAVAAVIGLWFLWKQSEHQRLPSFRSLDSDERDLLKAMHETKTYVVPSFNAGEIMPFIVHRATVDSYGLVQAAGLSVSPHYYEACLRLRDRGVLRKPESNIHADAEYELTPKGVRFLSKRSRRLDKHDNHGRFKDEVAIEEERRRKPNRIFGTAHASLGSTPLGSAIATVIEYPLISRRSGRLCDVVLPRGVTNVRIGDEVYLQLNREPLFLDNEEWLPVTVTQIREAGDARIFSCGRDVEWTANATDPDAGQN